MATKNQKIHGIIHATSVACGATAAGLSQAPGSDSAPLVALQTSMIISIAFVHGQTLTKAAAVDMLMTRLATMAGRATSQFLVGWFPGIGNAINAATAISFTEVVGWAANSLFEKEASTIT